MTASDGIPAWRRFVVVALALAVEEVRAEWRARSREGVHGAVDATLAALAEDPAQRAAERRQALASETERLDTDPALARLARAFELDGAERQLLALLAAAHVEPRVGAALGYLDDDPEPRAPTLTAAGRLFGWEPGAAPGPASPLARWELALPAESGGWQPDSAWALDPQVAAFLGGAPNWFEQHPGVRPAPPPAAECLHPALLDEMTTTVRSLLGPEASRPVELELVGRPGSGRRTLLGQLSAALGRAAVLIEPPASGVAGLRTARLLGAVPIRAGVEPEADPDPGALTLVATEAPRPGGAGDALRLSFRIPELTRGQRLERWRALSPREPTPAIGTWTLTPAELARAAAASAGGDGAITAQLRRGISVQSQSLVTAVPCPYGWEDLILAERVMRQLRDLESQIQLAGEVLDDWGFRRLTPERRGTTALFAGPSGTGKTMAASVLAASLGLDLYRVDLAQVVNKYIGETEKRLAQVFDECERSHVIVLFDEADALFGERTKVRDAHDRFANIEIDYLLSRMDTFDGVAILATNRKNELDTAFVRRLRVIVDFASPTPAERLRLWELALPGDSEVVGESVDHDRLARALDCSPAEIKAIALAAAFLARGAGELIGHEHVLAAARRELAKRGQVVREDSPMLSAASNGVPR